ncbi:MAG TPA: hypothetical protein VNN21_07280, partial [Dehalococcoidia bacterium]|nr:hypothetical protein [Dehalococcoidia bacterium]
EQLVNRALDDRVVRAARVAIQKIREGADKGEEVKKLREEVDKLTNENRELRDRLDKLEARLSPPASGAQA